MRSSEEMSRTKSTLMYLPFIIFCKERIDPVSFSPKLKPVTIALTLHESPRSTQACCEQSLVVPITRWIKLKEFSSKLERIVGIGR